MYTEQITFPLGESIFSRVPGLNSSRFPFRSRCLGNWSSQTHHHFWFSAVRHQKLWWSCLGTVGDSVFCQLRGSSFPWTQIFLLSPWQCQTGLLHPTPAGLVLLCGIHTFLLSVTQDTHFTDDLWYALGSLETDETGYNINTDDRPSNTVTLFKQAH